MDGQELKSALNLTNFEYVYIQKALALPFKLYIVTIDSRHPGRFIPVTRLKKSEVTWLGIKVRSIIRNIRLSPPLDLSSFRGQIPANAIVLRRDLAGDNFIDLALYEGQTFNRGYNHAIELC